MINPLIDTINQPTNSVYAGLKNGGEGRSNEDGFSEFDNVYREVSSTVQKNTVQDTSVDLLSIDNGPIYLTDISNLVKEDAKYVEDTLKSVYERLGIADNTTITLKTDPHTGNIEASSDELDDDMVNRIEEELNADDDFKNKFNRLSANSSLLEAVQRHMEFTEAYNNDPEAAVKQYGYLFNDNNSYAFSLNFDGSVVTTEAKLVVSV